MPFGLPALQVEAFALVISMVTLFAWGRWRYDLVAILVLLVAILAGVVPADRAFEGFSNPVIVIIASVFVVSKSISNSGILDRIVRTMLKDIKSPSAQIGVLTACVAFLSAVVKNVGTLGIFMPIAIQVARRSKRSPSIYLMPLSFGSLIGGTITLIGTSPNLLISAVRQELGGEPFRLLDFLPVGLPLTCLAIAFLSVGWRLLPEGRAGTASADAAFEIEKYTTELRITDKSPLVGKTVGELEQSGDGEVLVRAISREGGHHYLPRRHWPLYAGDIVTVQADSATIRHLTDSAHLELEGAKELDDSNDSRDELSVVEAIITADSPLIGQTPKSINLRGLYDLNLLAVSRAGQNRHINLQDYRFQIGDVVALQGWQNDLPAELARLGCLPLADRNLGLGQGRRGLISLAILAIAMILVSTHVIPIVVGFFASAVFVVLFDQISMKDAYESIEGPVIVMLGALIPLGEGLKNTGATDILGKLLGAAGAYIPGYGMIALIITVSMLLTPFLHHAAAVLVLGPVAAVVAKTLGFNMDPFLMAVALGCACDFLTPIGHQNNLLVMGPGGYRFYDYWRLGLPLSLLVVLGGTPLIVTVWPLG